MIIATLGHLGVTDHPLWPWGGHPHPTGRFGGGPHLADLGWPRSSRGWPKPHPVGLSSLPLCQSSSLGGWSTLVSLQMLAAEDIVVVMKEKFRLEQCQLEPSWKHSRRVFYWRSANPQCCCFDIEAGENLGPTGGGFGHPMAKPFFSLSFFFFFF